MIVCMPFDSEGDDCEDGCAGDGLREYGLEVANDVAEGPGILMPHGENLNRHS